MGSFLLSDTLSSLCPRLCTLNLSGCRRILTSTKKEGFTVNPFHLPLTLTSLDLREVVNDDNDVLGLIGNLTSLKTLMIGFVSEHKPFWPIATISPFYVVSNNSSLQNVWLGGCYRSYLPQGLVLKCHNLRFVNLSYSKINNGILRQLVEMNPHIIDLNLRCCVHISDASLIAIADHCPSLRSINVSCCSKISDNGLVPLVSKCSAITSLDLCYCPSITTETIMWVVQVKAVTPETRTGRSTLTKLGISGFTGLTDKHVDEITSSLPELELLGIGGCPLLGTTSIEYVSQRCLKLKSLVMHKLSVKMESLIQLLSSCRRLKALDIADCIIDTDPKPFIQEHFPSLILGFLDDDDSVYFDNDEHEE